MRRLTESLLQLARFDAGQETTDTAAALSIWRKTCASVWDASVHLPKSAASIFTATLAPLRLAATPIAAGQLITNLLTNAIHYNKPRGEILVSTRSEDGDTVLTVTDTGQGIAAEDVPHVFERFYRADKSRSRAEGRSGLGLAICKAIVDNHGGTIDASSELGAGATFTVRLPPLHAS